MSFLSVLQKIGGVTHQVIPIAQQFQPVIGLIPGAGGIFGTVLTVVSAVEKLIPEGSGEVKKEVSTKIVQAMHPTMDAAAISKKIQELVDALNTLQKMSETPVTAVVVK